MIPLLDAADRLEAVQKMLGQQLQRTGDRELAETIAELAELEKQLRLIADPKPAQPARLQLRPIERATGIEPAKAGLEGQCPSVGASLAESGSLPDGSDWVRRVTGGTWNDPGAGDRD